VSAAVLRAGGPADVTVVCVDVPGCEGGAILCTAAGGTVIFFSMATSFTAAALGAEGVAADITMLVGNGYVPGHAELALDLIRAHPGVRELFGRRIGGPAEGSSDAGSAASRGAPAEP
jgi:L-erythro-3,5-diaminohexanoate dehydrogenase